MLYKDIMNNIAKKRYKKYILQNKRCFYCNILMPYNQDDIKKWSSMYRIKTKKLQNIICTAEHLKAKQDGGTNSINNIVAACKQCNGKRHQLFTKISYSKYKKFVLTQTHWHIGLQLLE